MGHLLSYEVCIASFLFFATYGTTQFFLKSRITNGSSIEDFIHYVFFSISVVYIKEEPEDAAPHVKIEHEMKPLFITENGLNGTNYSMDDIEIKEEPLQDDIVSELWNG